MALSPRDKGEVRALAQTTVDEAIGKLMHHDGTEPLTADEQLVRLQAYVYDLDAENRLMRLALYGNKERAAIAKIAQHLGITVDLDVADVGQQRDD